MFSRLFFSKADAPDAAAAAEPAAAAVTAAAEAVQEAVKEAAAEAKEPEAAPAPPREPTEAEIAAAKAELVAEAVQRIVEAAGDDLVTSEVVTAPYDPRFPATNQARHCFVRYNEYHKCVYERGPDAERCAFYRRAYASMCPEEWVEEWQELRDKGLWMGKY